MCYGLRRGLVVVLAAVLLAACAGNDRPLSRQAGSAYSSRAGTGGGLPGEPARFVVLGADSQKLERLFGPPSLRRREPPAEYWRYDFPRCTLDLFLFRAPGEPQPRVVYFELRERSPYAAAQGCREIEARFELPAPEKPPLADVETH